MFPISNPKEKHFTAMRLNLYLLSFFYSYFVDVCLIENINHAYMSNNNNILSGPGSLADCYIQTDVHLISVLKFSSQRERGLLGPKPQLSFQASILLRTPYAPLFVVMDTHRIVVALMEIRFN